MMIGRYENKKDELENFMERLDCEFSSKFNAFIMGYSFRNQNREGFIYRLKNRDFSLLGDEFRVVKGFYKILINKLGVDQKGMFVFGCLAADTYPSQEAFESLLTDDVVELSGVFRETLICVYEERELFSLSSENENSKRRA